MVILNSYCIGSSEWFSFDPNLFEKKSKRLWNVLGHLSISQPIHKNKYRRMYHVVITVFYALKSPWYFCTMVCFSTYYKHACIIQLCIIELWHIVPRYIFVSQYITPRFVRILYTGRTYMFHSKVYVGTLLWDNIQPKLYVIP